MNRTKLKLLLVSSAFVVVLASCAPPKAIVIAEAPTQKKVTPKVEEPVVPDLPLTGLPDDGIRMPEMLGLPGDGEFRATNPSLPKTVGDTGAVISRPPTDPPSRVKPKPAATE